jgi:hypothetical protein
MLKRLFLKSALLLGCPLLGQSQSVLPLVPRLVQAKSGLADSMLLPVLPEKRRTTYCPASIITWQEEIFYGVPSIEPLLSRVVGMQVTPYSGAPGALHVVRLRGAVGLAANPQPLYLLDDVPVFQDLGAAQLLSAGLGQTGQFGLNPLLSLPVNDIESVTVTRGGLEAARYGAQGQYGVINIRTKAGKLMQPLRVRYDGYGGVQQARTRYSLLTASQFGALASEAASAAGQPPPYSASQLAALGQGTDWQQELLRTAAMQEHHVSLTAGRAATQYYVGADYLRQNGILLNSWLQRFALRAQVTQHLTPRLTLTGALALSQLTARTAAELLTLNMLTAPPTEAPYTADGQLTQPASYQNNPVRQALEEVRGPRQRQLLSRLALRYPLTGPLRASLLGQWEQNNLLQTRHLPDYAAPASRYADERADYRFSQATLTGALDFTRTLAARHALAARLEASWQHYRVAQETVLLPSDQLTPSVHTYGQRQNLVSPAMQADYTYAKRYQVQGSFRLDRSTKLPAANAWQPAFGAKVAWHAEEENFLHDSPWLTTLGVWVSYGRTSNAGSFFDFSQLPMPASSAPSGPAAGVPVLEKATQLEAGLTTRFRQWLTLQAVAYQRQTTPATSLPPPEYQVRIRGLELSLEASWHLRHTELSTTRLAIALQQNRFASALGYRLSDLGQYAQDGQSLSAFYGLRYLGVDAATGRPRYEDANGDGTISSSDNQSLGAGLPTCLLNLTQDLRYRRWGLQMQADALLGYTVYNYALAQLDNPTGLLNSSARVLGRWTTSHRATDVPAAGQAVGFGSYQLQSGNNARLSSLIVSYKIRQNAAHELAVWAGGRNLLVISNYRGFDPNVSSGGAGGGSAGLDVGAYPVPRTWLLGVRATL